MNNSLSDTDRTVVWVEPSAFPKKGYRPPANVYTGVMMPRAGASMAARLEQFGYRTVIISGELTPLSSEMIAQHGKIVCISVLSNSAPYGLVLAHQLRKLGCTVIMGGYHFAHQQMTETALALTTQALGFCQFVVRGEGYDALPALLKALEQRGTFEAVGGLSWRDNQGQTHHNPQRETTTPYEELPIPKWTGLIDAHEVMCLPVQGQRGCPRSCTWCAVVARDGKGGPKSRRQPQQFADEINVARQTLTGAKHIFVTADNINAATRWLSDVCDILTERPPGLTWSCQAEVPVFAANPELARKMARAGCRRVCLGIESLFGRALQDSNKRQSVEEIERAIAIAHENGIDVHGMLIVGLPGDDRETIAATRRWAEQQGIETVQFLCLIDLPGSEDSERDLSQRAFRPFQGAFAPLNSLFVNGHYARLSNDSCDLTEIQDISLDNMTRFYRLGRVFSALLKPRWNVRQASRARGEGHLQSLQSMLWAQVVTAYLRMRGWSNIRAWKQHPLNIAYIGRLRATTTCEIARTNADLLEALPADWLETFEEVYTQEAQRAIARSSAK